LKLGNGLIFALSRSRRHPSLSRNMKRRITRILLLMLPDTLLKPKTVNELLPIELDPNPIVSRTETDLSRDVGNEVIHTGIGSCLF
jgi:hypothetical protein